MVFKTKCEFRGFTTKEGKNGTYIFCNLEDENGESLRFNANNVENLKDFKKGDKVIASIEYNANFKSLLLVEVVKNDKT